MNKMDAASKKSIAIITLLALSLIWFSCDERTPTDSSDSGVVNNYSVVVTHQHMAKDNNDLDVVVGEDIAGTGSNTRLTATLKNASGNPVAGAELDFSAIAAGSSAGSFVVVGESTTDENGIVQVDYLDEGAAMDNLSTATFDGVTVTASYRRDGVPANPDTVVIDKGTTSFNVIDTAAVTVWPYRMIMSRDNDVIYVDQGATKSTITVHLLNYQNQPIEGILIGFATSPDTLGLLSPTFIITDSNGEGSVEFTDIGDPENVGEATITASFTHPVFSTLAQSKSVVIQEEQSSTGINIALTVQPVVGTTDAPIIVGEDVNDNAPGSSQRVRTKVTAEVTDQAGNPLNAKMVDFFAIFGADTSETSFDLPFTLTNTEGYAVSNFYDEGRSAVDNISTPEYEGVTVVAKVGDLYANGRFNVYESVSDVWEYRLNLYRDPDHIYLDNGQTKSSVTAILSNKLNKPLKNVEITFSATKGYIEESAITDSTGTAVVEFTDLGDQDDVGISEIQATYNHPAFGNIDDQVQVTVLDPYSTGIPDYITIPASHPGDIMVTGGGGLESTDICAKVYDKNGVLVDSPVQVTFSLGPATPDGVHFSSGGMVDSASTSNGTACVAVIAGTRPGPIYVTAAIGDTISATAIPVIVVTGPAHNIFPDLDINSIAPIGGGFYQMEVAALVNDLHGNPVADSTYVYWNIAVAPSDADSIIDAEIIGVSFTNNTSLSNDNFPGLAYSYLIYPSRGIFDVGRIQAYTYGVGGEVIIDSVENDALLPYYGDNLILVATPTFHDFTTGGSPVNIQLQAILTDYYSNPVENANILFIAPGGGFLTANPTVTNGDGIALAMVQYVQDICPPIPNTDPQLYEDFTSSCTAILLDPMGATADPTDIVLVRSYQGTR